MIGRIAGIVLHRGPDHVLIDVRGVGYIVQASDRTLAALPPVGQAAALWTELLVREDALTLIGFQTLAEKEWHRLLMTVQGVGPRAALAILGTLGPDALARAIALGDARALQAAPGVGPKLAARVALELKARAPAAMALGAAANAPAEPGDMVIEAPPRPAPAIPQAAATAEAMSALTNLGYPPGDAAAAVSTAAAETPGATTPALIRAALRSLAPRV